MWSDWLFVLYFLSNCSTLAFIKKWNQMMLFHDKAIHFYSTENYFIWMYYKYNVFTNENMYLLSKYFIYYIKFPYNISTRSFIKKINEPLKFFLSIQKKFKTFITKNKNSKKSQISISTLSPEHTNSKRHFTSPALTINPHLHTPHIITLEYHNSGRK